MNYTEMIQKKTRILAITLLICIVLRAIVNGFFISFSQVAIYVIGGLVLTAILLALNKFVNPIVMMYMMVVLMSLICVVLMIAFPCTTNYLMFFLAIFFVVIYEDIRPIVMQCVLNGVCMIYFYNKFADKLAETWTIDAMAMCIVYIVSGMLVFISLCRLTRQQFAVLEDTTKESVAAKDKAESLLSQIGSSVTVLGESSDQISSSIGVTEEISDQIAVATEDVAKRAMEEVREVEEIKKLVEDGVEQIQSVAESSLEMTKASDETNQCVEQGGKTVAELTTQMKELNEKMQLVSSSIIELSEENKKIVEILHTLDEITSQTNLLSLNASIEAARAGEHGRGFAVVATEIRQLSDNSSKFTEQIHDILDGIQNQTLMLRQEIEEGQQYVDSCSQGAIQVDDAFHTIEANNQQVIARVSDIASQSDSLQKLMEHTLTNVSRINENVESTSEAMEQISTNIRDLHGNIDTVVSGYHQINTITGELVKASNG